MKFSCGAGRPASVDKANRRVAQLHDWHAVFAFLPHRVTANDCRWLETIERRLPGAHKRSTFADWFFYGHDPYVTGIRQGYVAEYRALEK